MSMAGKAQACLQAAGIDYGVLEHAPSCGSRDTALAAHVAPDHVAKGVILRDDAGFLMAIIPGSHWVRVDALRRELGRPGLELTPEDDLRRLFPDCELGSVPPLPEAYGLPAVLDEALCSLANVYLETGDHRLLAHLDAAAFARLTRGLRHGRFSHPG